jgi:hypothetical protein
MFVVRALADQSLHYKPPPPSKRLILPEIEPSRRGGNDPLRRSLGSLGYPLFCERHPTLLVAILFNKGGVKVKRIRNEAPPP